MLSLCSTGPILCGNGTRHRLPQSAVRLSTLDAVCPHHLHDLFPCALFQFLPPFLHRATAEETRTTAAACEWICCQWQRQRGAWDRGGEQEAGLEPSGWATKDVGRYDQAAPFTVSSSPFSGHEREARARGLGTSAPGLNRGGAIGDEAENQA